MVKADVSKNRFQSPRKVLKITFLFEIYRFPKFTYVIKAFHDVSVFENHMYLLINTEIKHSCLVSEFSFLESLFEINISVIIACEQASRVRSDGGSAERGETCTED